jgi:hypothetical protein
MAALHPSSLKAAGLLSAPLDALPDRTCIKEEMTMSTAIRMAQIGGPGVLNVEQFRQADPGSREVSEYDAARLIRDRQYADAS